MMKLRIPRKSMWCIFSISLFLLVVISPNQTTRAQGNQALSPEQASAIAANLVLMEQTTIPSWEGAEISSPLVHYDLRGQIAAFVFTVLKAGKDAGYITISGTDLPNPVLEFSTKPAPSVESRSTVKAAAEKMGFTIDEQKPLYLGMLAYFYQIGNQEPVQLLEMSSLQIITLDSFALNFEQSPTDDGQNFPDVQYNTLLDNMLKPGASQSTNFKLLYGSDYDWYRGCAPTATANVMGHWADRGYPNLVYGGSNGDFLGTIDQLAALMHTSSKGWTNLPINDDIKKFATQRGYAFKSSESSKPSYAKFVSEIDAHRPIVVLVNGHIYYGDHFITGFGYEYDPANPGYRYMIVHDTWGSTPEDVWVQFGTGYGKIWFDTVVPPEVQVDNTPPTSSVNALPVHQNSVNFPVSWSGVDQGWGIQWYDIQYRDNQNQEWIDWVANTTATQTSFYGDAGHTYCFRSRAMDIDHNQEPYPESENTCTSILPSLVINYHNGKPQSLFTLTGSGYPAGANVAIIVNGHTLGLVPTNSTGGVSFILDTNQANEGNYVVTTRANYDVSVVFRLDSSEPLRSQTGSSSILQIPGGIALTSVINLPVLTR
jgi:hypothetical protein